ncbi:MAG: helix-turn-helix domain-containing protein [Cyanobacteria bacterium J083]|nr:MAG: helix-turn-helix domain-containing protein [Cyanobacteria bacterium J083]
MPQPQIGLLIKQLRSAMNLTQEEFAHLCGVVFSTVNCWEKGHTQPSPMALKLIALQLKSIGKPGEELLETYHNN